MSRGIAAPITCVTQGQAWCHSIGANLTLLWFRRSGRCGEDLAACAKKFAEGRRLPPGSSGRKDFADFDAIEMNGVGLTVTGGSARLALEVPGSGRPPPPVSSGHDPSVPRRAVPLSSLDLLTSCYSPVDCAASSR